MNSVPLLDVNGQLISGWEKFNATFDMENLSTSFSFELYDKEGTITRSLRTGLECNVQVENLLAGVRNQSLAPGYIANTTRSINESTHTFSMTGHDKLIDLVDCAAIYKSQTWTKTKFSSIVTDLLDPFGLKVDKSSLNPNDDTLIEKFTIQSGETAFESIERLCRSQAILPLSTFDGNLYLGYAATQFDRATDLEVGVNVKQLDEYISWEERYSTYIGLSQYPGSGKKWSKEVLQNKYTAYDVGVDRYRPMMFIAESKADRKILEKRVAWEAQVRSGRATEYTAVVQGWFQKTKQGMATPNLWEKNKRLNLKFDDWDLNKELLITKVNLSLDNSAGEITTLTLKHPDIFKPDPTERVDLT